MAPGVGAAELFSFDGEARATTDEFAAYLTDQTADRTRMRGQDARRAAREMYRRFVSDRSAAYAEERLGQDNPAFYNLMREYEEGILLFEATKLNVWDKAGQDTAGLEAFFRANQPRYQWRERLVIDYYTFPSERRAEIEPILTKLAKKKSPEEVLARLNADTTVVTHQERAVERGREPSIDAMEWKRGQRTAPQVNESRGTVQIGIVREVLPKGPKQLNAARGYVIADYQDELERRWVDELAEEFPIVVNEEALQSLVE